MQREKGEERMKKISRDEQAFQCVGGDKLKISTRNDGKAVILESMKRELQKFGGISFTFTEPELEKVLIELIAYLEEWGITNLTPEDKCYNEEINVFKDGVERSINTNARTKNFSFIAYTDDEDAYWTYLTPKKLKYFVELMLPGLKEPII